MRPNLFRFIPNGWRFLTDETENAENTPHPQRNEQETEQTQAAAQGTTEEQDQVEPQQIATRIFKFLRNEGIPQRFFAKEILNRSQGTFSDYLTKPPQQMPKAHGRGTWLRLQEFIDSKNQQEELVKLYRKGKWYSL